MKSHLPPLLQLLEQDFSEEYQMCARAIELNNLQLNRDEADLI
jgi:hypothetical protein